MKTTLLFGITSILLYVTGVIFFDVDIELVSHDTYFIINKMHISSFTAVLLLFITLVYFLFVKFSRPLNPNLGRIHYILSVFPVLIFLLFEKQFIPDESGEFKNLFVLGVLFLAGQLLFLSTIVWALTVRRKY